MKNSKRTLALLLALLLTSSALFSCSSGETADETPSSGDSPATEETVAETDPPYDGLEAEDFGGITFTILNRAKSPNYNAHPNPEIEAEEQNGEVLNDSLYDRNQKIQEKYNIEFASVTFASHDDISKEIETSVIAGDATYDAVLPSLNNGFQMAMNGRLYEVSEIPNLQLDRAWWWANIAKDTSLAGKNYFVAGDVNVGSMNSAGLIYFNKQLLSDYQLESPYAIVDEGKWTLDAMATLSSAITHDVDGNGTMDHSDVYGTVSSSFGWQPLFYGSGQLLIAKDEQDLPYLDAASEANYDHIAAIVTFLNDKTTTYNVNHSTGFSDLGKLTVDMFYNNQALFFIEVMYGVPQFRDMESDFGLLPLPKANENQQDYSTYLGGNATGVAVPVSNTNLEMTGKILEDLVYYSNQYVRPAFYDVMLKSKFARDDDSARMLDIILSNFTIDLALVMRSNGIDIDGMMRTAATEGTTDIVSSIVAKEKQYTKILNSAVEALQ